MYLTIRRIGLKVIRASPSDKYDESSSEFYFKKTRSDYRKKTHIKPVSIQGMQERSSHVCGPCVPSSVLSNDLETETTVECKMFSS